METSYLEQETAIREVGRGYDIIKQLQGLHQFKQLKGEEVMSMHDLAEPLFKEALQALNHALCNMKSCARKFEVKSESVVIATGPPVYSSLESAISYESNHRLENGRGKRRRVRENSWISNTTMPYDDGYQWRKYGDKKISGSKFSRSYFRCTYEEKQGCQAKKLVEQTSNIDPPLFKVTYKNNHTCNVKKTTSTYSSPQPSSYGSIKQDNSINAMLHLEECEPSMPQLMNQGSNLGDNNLGEIFTSSCEWDIGSLLMDLEGVDGGFW